VIEELDDFLHHCRVEGAWRRSPARPTSATSARVIATSATRASRPGSAVHRAPRGERRRSHGALFRGVQGRRLSQTILTQTFLRYTRAAGVTDRSASPRTPLQHVFASELLRAGANLRQIQELRGAVKRLRFAGGPRS
jgi:hypothetical protein